MSEEGREHLEAENEALREQNAAQAAEIERLTRMVDELTRRLDKGSKNSSIPPSADSPRHQAEATRTRAERRAEAKAKRRDEVERNRGKQPGAPARTSPCGPIPTRLSTTSRAVACPAEKTSAMPLWRVSSAARSSTPRTRSSSPPSTARSADGARVGR